MATAGRLGRLLVLTDRSQASRPLLDVLRAAVDAGARTVVVREKDLPTAQRLELTGAVTALLDSVAGTVILAGGPGPRVHLAAADPLPVPRPELVGRSCHDAGEVDRADAEGVDYLTCSPVYPSGSKPGYGPVLGAAGLGALCRRTPVAVYALGGVTARTAARCRAAGAAGVAVMGEVMRAADPDRTVAELLAGLA
jgi:thiamine-phosphate pyrophosphorylase